MSRKYKIRNQNHPHFVTLTVINWIDLFTRNLYRDILMDSLLYCRQHKGLLLYAWCLMPSHLHMIIGTRKNPMQDILRDFKSFTSRTLREVISKNPRESRRKWILEMMRQAGRQNKHNRNWQLWQQHNHPIELSTNIMIDQRLEYVHMNPVKAGFVDCPEHWKYSSAKTYAGSKGVLDICQIE